MSTYREAANTRAALDSKTLPCARVMPPLDKVAAVVILQDAHMLEVVIYCHALLQADLTHALIEEAGRDVVRVHYHLLHVHPLRRCILDVTSGIFVL